MKEAMETSSTASGNTGWDGLSEVPFIGQSTETPPEEQDDGDDGLIW